MSAMLRISRELAAVSSRALELQKELDQAWSERAAVQRELDTTSARLARREVRLEWMRQASIRDTELRRDLNATLIRVRQQRDAALLDLAARRRTDAGLSAADLEFIAENRAVDRMADV
jgi:hypothetical protein